MSEFTLDHVNDMYVDVLREIGNIGAGNATTAIAKMLGSRLNMQVPNVKLMEASQLDGLSFWGRVFRIDLPLISGQLKYFLVMGFIGGLQNYSMQYAITNGGPGEVIDSMQSGTMVPGYYIYRLITGSSKTGAYGYACAMGVVMFAIIMIITVINNKLIKSKE